MAAQQIRVLGQTLIDAADEAERSGLSHVLERIQRTSEKLHAIISRTKADFGGGQGKRARRVSSSDESTSRKDSVYHDLVDKIGTIPRFHLQDELKTSLLYWGESVCSFTERGTLAFNAQENTLGQFDAFIQYLGGQREHEQLRRRLSVYLLSKWHDQQRRIGVSKTHILDRITTAVSETGQTQDDTLRPRIRRYILEGRRYTDIAFELGGPGILALLPSGTRLLWEENLKKDGPRRRLAMELLKAKGISDEANEEWDILPGYAIRNSIGPRTNLHKLVQRLETTVLKSWASTSTLQIALETPAHYMHSALPNGADHPRAESLSRGKQTSPRAQTSFTDSGTLTPLTKPKESEEHHKSLQAAHDVHPSGSVPIPATATIYSDSYCLEGYAPMFPFSPDECTDYHPMYDLNIS